MEAEEQEEDEFLPEHTKSMRAAMRYCLQLDHELTTRSKRDAPTTIRIDEKIASAALTLPEQRQQALNKFLDEPGLPVIDIELSSRRPSALEFRKQFQNSNIPCLIRGMDKSCFASVSSQWRLDCKNDSVHGINREWFRTNIGSETTVPVRYQASTSSTALDDDGRAEECETQEMTLSDWLELLDQAAKGDDKANQYTNYDEFYLKDWHLQSQLKGNTIDSPLYQVPAFFQYDLLNAFLTKFTKGDYMFTYWGPAGSSTSLHSDVLNSFSWSYNVSGTKEWKFFPEDGEQSICLTVIQQAGECIFVSSGWRHEVKNLEETLSINHNWITTANLDLTWDCMCSEMKAVESELESWGLPQDCWDARESMLRGGCGLDVTAFFFMLLTRLLELLNLKTDMDHESSNWQCHFDLVRLVEGLRAPMREHTSMNLVCLERRLEAVLQSPKSASKAIELAKKAIDEVS